MYSLRRICLSVQTECTQFQNKGQRSSSLPGPTYFTLKVAKSQKDFLSTMSLPLALLRIENSPSFSITPKSRPKTSKRIADEFPRF